jgi:hypothetical protein
MTRLTDDTPNKDADRVLYFVIRIRASRKLAGAGISGTLERLGSNQAQQFSDAEELLVLLSGGVTGTTPAAQPNSQ